MYRSVQKLPKYSRWDYLIPICGILLSIFFTMMIGIAVIGRSTDYYGLSFIGGLFVLLFSAALFSASQTEMINIEKRRAMSEVEYVEETYDLSELSISEQKNIMSIGKR